jgi:hypothetical protein
MSAKWSSKIPKTGPKTYEKAEFVSLLSAIVSSINERADRYFWMLTGDSPASLSTLIGCEKHLMIHILAMCDLYSEDSQKYTKNIKDLTGCFLPCGITWNKQRGGPIQCYLQIWMPRR